MYDIQEPAKKVKTLPSVPLCGNPCYAGVLVFYGVHEKALSRSLPKHTLTAQRDRNIKAASSLGQQQLGPACVTGVKLQCCGLSLQTREVQVTSAFSCLFCLFPCSRGRNGRLLVLPVPRAPHADEQELINTLVGRVLPGLT